MEQPTEYRMLREAADVTDEVVAEIDDCLDFFEGSPLGTEDFIDRFATTYLNQMGIDIDNYDNPATRKIMREARRIRREREA